MNCGHRDARLLLQLFEAARVSRVSQEMAAFFLRQCSCLQDLQNETNGMLKAALVVQEWKAPNIPMN